jgi:hypothetical protein
MHSTTGNHKARPTAAPRDVDGERERLRLLESRIQFPDDTAWAQDMPSASAFRTALCDVLRAEDAQRLYVRCAVARDDENLLKFMCKVEYVGNDEATGPASHAWSWWSPLVARPEELLVELRRALRHRHEQMTSSRHSTDRTPPKVDKARGPAHGTWSTDLWDLGRGDQDEGFCRNRRSRWPSYAASQRPLRPRYPR